MTAPATHFVLGYRSALAKPRRTATRAQIGEQTGDA